MRLVLPLATMMLALLFLGYHGVVVWQNAAGSDHTTHITASSGGDHSWHAFEGMRAEHGDSAETGHPDCADSNAECLNAMTKLALPAPPPTGGILLRPALSSPLSVFEPSPRASLSCRSCGSNTRRKPHALSYRRAKDNSAMPEAARRALDADHPGP